MGKCWTTPAQRKWLDDRLYLFLEAQKKKRSDRFITTTTEEFFRVFPEQDALWRGGEEGLVLQGPLSPEQKKVYDKAVDKRKKVSMI